MKVDKLFIIFIVSFLFLQNIYAQKHSKYVLYSQIDCENDTLKCSDKIIKTLKIFEIKKQNAVYIIYGSDEKERPYTILSRSTRTKKYDNIKIGNEYKFYLVPFFDLDVYPNYENKDIRLIGGCDVYYIEVSFKIIRIVSCCDNNFYGSPNLVGLNYIPYNGTEENQEYPYFRSHANLKKYGYLIK